MAVLRFMLTLYFAAMLGVAGLAKMELPALFAALSVVQTYLLIARRAAPCGCYGAWSTRNIAGASATTIALLTGFAGLYRGLVCHGAAIAAPWRVLAVAQFVGCEGWIGWRTWQRHRPPHRAPRSVRAITGR